MIFDVCAIIIFPNNKYRGKAYAQVYLHFMCLMCDVNVCSEANAIREVIVGVEIMTECGVRERQNVTRD